MCFVNKMVSYNRESDAMGRRRGFRFVSTGVRPEEGEVLVEKEPKTSQWPIVEAFTVLYMAAGFPLLSIIAQYQVVKVADMMGYDYHNLTASSNSSDQCSMDQSDPSYLTRQAIQAEAANWGMYISLFGFLPGTISPIILGSLADRYGRRCLFVLPCIGSIFAVSIYMITIWYELPIWMLLIAQLENCFGGFGVIFIGVFAYTADTVPMNKRAFRMTIIDAVALGNGAIANLFVGYWIKAQGFFYPLIFVICGKGIALLYAIFLIPETLKRTQPAEESKRLTIKDTLSAFKLCLYDDGTGRRWKLNILLMSVAVAELVTIQSVITMFLMNTPLCWSSVQIGNYIFTSMLVLCVSMVVASVIPHHWISADWKVVISRVSYIVHNIYIVFVTSTAMMYLFPVIGCLGFLAVPITRYILSCLVSPEENASVFAIMSMLRHLTNLVSSFASNMLYRDTLMVLHGTIVFLAGAGCGAISLGLMLIYMWKNRKPSRGERIPSHTIPVADFDNGSIHI